MQKSGVDVSAAAELGFYVPIGATVSSSSSKQDYKAFSQHVSQQSLAGIPCRPLLVVASCAPDYTAWGQAVDANPMPIRITLASIVKLLVPKYFPSDHNITAKATQLAAFLATGYCGDVPSCGPAPPAPPLACASSCPTSRCNTTTGLCASCPTKVENEDCSGHGTCSHLSGACTCDSGFAGPSCACATSFKVEEPKSEHNGDFLSVDRCCTVAGREQCNDAACGNFACQYMLGWATHDLQQALYPLSANHFPANFSFTNAKGTYSEGSDVSETLKLSYPWTSPDPVGECTSLPFFDSCTPMQDLECSVDVATFAELDAC